MISSIAQRFSAPYTVCMLQVKIIIIQIKSFYPWLIVNSLCLLALIIHELEAAQYLSTLVFEYSVTAVLCLRWSRSQG